MSYDLVDNEDISEGAILEEIRRRFLEDVIYSSIGPIIIALNPYKDIIGLYSSDNMQMYIEMSEKFGTSVSN